jgi:integral membrane sensor domain MASE1
LIGSQGHEPFAIRQCDGSSGRPVRGLVKASIRPVERLLKVNILHILGSWPLHCCFVTVALCTVAFYRRGGFCLFCVFALFLAEASIIAPAGSFVHQSLGLADVEPGLETVQNGDRFVYLGLGMCIAYC